TVRVPAVRAGRRRERRGVPRARPVGRAAAKGGRRTPGTVTLDRRPSGRAVQPRLVRWRLRRAVIARAVALPALSALGRGGGRDLLRRRCRRRALAAGLAGAGAMLSRSAFGWPLVCGGILKLVYDLLLLAQFRSVQPAAED